MSVKKIYDLAVVTGSYTDRTGAQKNRYQNIGAVMQKDDGGKFLLVERTFIPAGVPHDPSKGNSIIVSMFEPRVEGQAPAAATGAARPDTSDEIPF